MKCNFVYRKNTYTTYNTNIILTNNNNNKKSQEWVTYKIHITGNFELSLFKGALIMTVVFIVNNSFRKEGQSDI